MQSGVLFVPSTSEASGVTTYVSGLCEALGSSGSACLAEPGSDLDAALPGGCRRVATGSGRLAMTRALRAERGRYAFVQTHGARALLAARLAGIPASRLGHVFHEPGDQQGLRGTLEVMLARGVRVAANAPSTARWVDRRLGGHADVLPPAVKPVPLVDRSAAREALGIPADAELVIGVVGRLSPVKMPELAVAAAARLASGRALVVFVGDGPERDRLRRIGAESGVAVSLPGRVPQAARLLSAFDVLAVPSPYETFGLALAEAAAAAIPVAAVDSPGARTVAEACGMTTPCAATAAGLGAAIASALDEPSDVRAERAERVLAAFGPEATAGRVRAYFEAFTGSAPDARR